MKLNLRIIEADNIPKMDVLGKADPFVIVYLSESKQKDQTEHKSKTYTPKWDRQMCFQVISLAEYAKFELKDYDKATKSDPIGSYQRRIKDFQPGIVKDEWITLEKAKGVKKAARLHIISHLAYEDMQPFVQYPFQFMKIVVNVQSIRGISKPNPSEKFNPYVLVGTERCSSIRFKTKELKNTNEPVWNEDIPLDLTNPMKDVLLVVMRDKYNGKDTDSFFVSIPIGQFQPFAVYDHEYDMAPLNGMKSGGKIKLRTTVIPIDAQPWMQPAYAQPPMQMQPGMYQQQMPQQGMYQQQMPMQMQGQMQPGMYQQQAPQQGMYQQQMPMQQQGMYQQPGQQQQPAPSGNNK